MLNNKRNIEQIVQKGFSQMPIDDLTIARATDAIVLRSKEVGGEKESYLWHSAPKLLYALAATIALICSFTYMQLFKNQVQLQSKVEQVNSSNLQSSQASILSHVGNPNALIANNTIKTDGQSQVLIALGNRTKVILFEKSVLNVVRTDSLHVDISLCSGSIAVDVTPGGYDTISVRTSHGVFTQLGTRFSVYVDSLNGAAELEVFRGKVRVTDETGTDLPVSRNQAWKSSHKKAVSALSRSINEIDEIHKTFTDNKISKRLIWNNSSSEKEITKPELSTKTDHFDDKVNSNADIVKTIQELVDKENYGKIDSLITQFQKQSLIDTLHEALRKRAERETSLFRFSKAEKVLNCIVEGKPFKMHQREDAWMRLYFIHKENINSSSDEKMKLIRRYQLLFPQGTFGDDVLAESIQLKLVLQKYTEAVLDMEKLFEMYSQSSHCEEFHYIYASTLRNQLHMIKPALDAYKKYTVKYPKGKYEEDALYWIVELSRETGDQNSFYSYKKIYLDKYSDGRWIEAVKGIDSSRKRR